MTCTFQPRIKTEPEYILKMRESESERSDIEEEESDLIHLSVRQGHWFEMLTQARSAPIWWGFWPSLYQIPQCGDERSGEAEGVRVSSLLQTCVNIVGDQRAGPRTCRSYLREKQRKMGSLSIHVLRFTQCSGLGKGGREHSTMEGNTPTADEGENKGWEKQKTTWIEEPDKRRLSWKQKNNAMVGGVKRCIKDIKEWVRRNYQGWEIWASHEWGFHSRPPTCIPLRTKIDWALFQARH